MFLLDNIINSTIINNFTIMKKYLFLLSVAAVAMTACTSETEEFVGSEQAREISFSPITQKHTRAAVESTTFPDNQKMYVAAYDATKKANFFAETEFSGTGSSWKGGKYWPLSPATINFLAYTGFTAGTATWNTTNPASQVVLAMVDNKTAQNDLMYACGTGSVTQNTANTLGFPTNVPMEFMHAQAWISFNANATSAANGKVTLNKITLNGAKYSGTYTVTHTNYNATSGQSVAGAWSALGSTANVDVPGWTTAAIAYAASPSVGVAVGNGLMIVPDDDNNTADFTSFTVNYTLDGNTYDYTYTPESDTAKNVDQAKHYIYNITFGVNEIVIAPTVANWADGGSNSISIK